MARNARSKSSSGYYHVLLRGVNKQDLFFDDMDREKMTECFFRFQEETEVFLTAYCLMSNHIHLLLKAGDHLDLFVKKLASSYVFYFNRKYERVGHLFQDRFRSESVEDERYLLNVFRYILQNPWKAGICRPEEYAWSSWKSLTGKGNDCDISILVDLAGGLRELKSFVLIENTDEFLDMEQSQALSDSQAAEMALQITGVDNLQKIAAYGKEQRNMMLAQMKKAGISVRQISRLTGINRNVIQRAK